MTTDSTTENRTHDEQNELTQVGSSSLTFDNNGNTTTDQEGRQLIYDAWNRLVQVNDSGSAPILFFEYDAHGGRKRCQEP